VAISVGGAAVLLAALDTYVVVTLLTDMAASMHVALNRLEQATPIVTGFLLGYVAGMPLLGGLSDKLGRRAVVQISLAGFAVGSALTAACMDISEYLSEYAEINPLHLLIAGRAVQGLAGGALLPVTMALVADLWSEERRPEILGTVGAAQELGSVLGPLYGFALAELVHWQGVFWVNVPLTLLAMVAVHFALPGRKALTGERRKVDVVGGLLLAASLGLLTVGLNNQNPRESVLPPHGREFIIAGTVVFVLFAGWQWVARTKLIDLTGLRKTPFFAVLAASFIAGAALLVTLLDIELFAKGVLRLEDNKDAALLLVRFLVALPVGAVVGGYLARRLGLRGVTVAGFLISTLAYWLVSRWPIDVLSTRYELLGISLPVFDTDLALAGLGLGLVIAPLSAAVLQILPAAQHGVASAGVVLARTMGMLIGFASLTAWGLHRFFEMTKDLQTPQPPVEVITANNDGVVTAAEQAAIDAYNVLLAEYNAKVNDALLTEYHQIFFATAVCCLAAAVISLAIHVRRAEAPAAVEAGEATVTV
jgi:MFS family permease